MAKIAYSEADVTLYRLSPYVTVSEKPDGLRLQQSLFGVCVRLPGGAPESWRTWLLRCREGVSKEEAIAELVNVCGVDANDFFALLLRKGVLE